MPTRKFIAAAVLALALLTVTAPAHAATVTVEALNSVTFPEIGYTLTGTLDFDLSAPIPILVDYAPNGFAVNGTFTQIGTHQENLLTGLFSLPPPYAGPYIFADIVINVGALPDLTPSDFVFNGAIGEGGTVTCTSGCSVSVVPLPAALPLFGSALSALAGFAAWRSRRSPPHSAG